MRIAVPYENGQIFQHFGHSEHFKIYTVVEREIVDTMVLDTNGSGHGALAGLLMGCGIDTLLCGGIGGGAQMALQQANIRFFGGCSGDADQAVQDLLAGKLVYDPNVHCDHHQHPQEEGHSCTGSCGSCGHCR